MSLLVLKELDEFRTTVGIILLQFDDRTAARSAHSQEQFICAHIHMQWWQHPAGDMWRSPIRQHLPSEPHRAARRRKHNTTEHLCTCDGASGIEWVTR
ncbi:hypothetical protein GN956_G18995 [Arapaima gigas]